jgi:hypothetical protein
MTEPQDSLPTEIIQNENIPINFFSNSGSICTRNKSVLNASSTYKLYKNLTPANAVYLNLDDINNGIKFINNNVLGADYKTCTILNNTILPLVGNSSLINLYNALKYCSLLKDKCIGITSLDANNIYWNLISSMSMDENNNNLIIDYKNTYLQDTINLSIEKFEEDKLPSIVPISPYFIWTDGLMIKTVIIICIIACVIYYYYYKKKFGKFSFSNE